MGFYFKVLHNQTANPEMECRIRHYADMLFTSRVTTSCEQENLENTNSIAQRLRQLRTHKTIAGRSSET